MSVLRKSTCENTGGQLGRMESELQRQPVSALERTFQGAQISNSSITLPPGGPMPSLNVTALFIKLSVSSRTSQADMGAMKSSGLWHLTCMTSQNSARVRTGAALGGLMG